MDNVIDLAAARVAKLGKAEREFRQILSVHLESLAETMGVKVDGDTFGDLVVATFEGLAAIVERLPLRACNASAVTAGDHEKRSQQAPKKTRPKRYKPV